MPRSSVRLGSAASAQLASARPSEVPNCRASTDRTDGLLQVPICHSVPREAAPRDAGSGTIDARPCDGLGFVTATDRRTGPCRARNYTLVDAVDGGWKAACRRPRRRGDVAVDAQTPATNVLFSAHHSVCSRCSCAVL